MDECEDGAVIERALQMQKPSFIVNESVNLNENLDGATYEKSVVGPVTTPTPLSPSSSVELITTKAIVETKL